MEVEELVVYEYRGILFCIEHRVMNQMINNDIKWLMMNELMIHGTIR